MVGMSRNAAYSFSCTRTIWTQAQGLTQDTIRAIAQTRDGYLWVGTSEGLARFDGYEFGPDLVIVSAI
jgi:ligand-binding sensor domain-containing protein